MENSNNYNAAVKYISKSLRAYLENVPEAVKEETYEIRLRSCRPVSLYGSYGTYFIGNGGDVQLHSFDSLISTCTDVKDSFNRICSYSIHSFQRFINNGYIPMENGNRAGVCGTAVCDKDDISSVKDISSINIRISREKKGCADNLLKKYQSLTGSIIIAGPPSSGKTTIIRDLARQLSNAQSGKYYKVAVIDERREISGISDGIITNDIGVTSDILDSYPKADAIDIAVRTLSPEIIICDEISTDKEIEAIRKGINCGVRFVVTVHAGSQQELYTRKQIEELLMTYSFSKLFLLGTGSQIGEITDEFDSGELLNEISLRRIGCSNYCR